MDRLAIELAIATERGEPADPGHILLRGAVRIDLVGDADLAEDLHRPLVEVVRLGRGRGGRIAFHQPRLDSGLRSEEHTSELQSLMRISYAVFCLKKKNN